MNEGETGRMPGKLAKGIGGLTMILGGVWMVMVVFPVKRVFSGEMEVFLGEKEVMDYLFLFLVVLLLAIPGILGILGGYRFFREVNLPNLKALVGVYSAFGGLVVYSRLADHFHDHGLWHERIDTSAFFLIGIVSGVMIYLLAMRWLVPVMGMKWAGCRSVLGKGLFLLIAWELWQVLSAIAQEVLPVTGEGGSGNILIVLLGPISVAWGFHILAVNWLKAGQQVPTAPSP